MNQLDGHGVVAIIVKDDKILFEKDSRQLMLGLWGPPHGRCELTDENEEMSVIREVKEETNLDVKPIRKLWTVEADVKTKTISFWLVEQLSEDLVFDTRETSEIGWFTVDEALNLTLYPATKTFLEKVKAGKISLA